jgi:hypothetical protein
MLVYEFICVGEKNSCFFILSVVQDGSVIKKTAVKGQED